METQKSLLKDEDGEEVDVHLYRSMIGSLMYLTPSRPDIMFVLCACARYQVNPKVSHLHAVKRIFRYLKGQPKLGLWYPKDSPFDLVAYTNSDYAGASLDRKSTTGGCQLLGCRLISWQCKKQTVVANSTTEAEYVAASSCCGQVLWIQNQLLDYRDCNEKKLIQMVKIHTDKNVADLLTKAFDVIILNTAGIINIVKIVRKRIERVGENKNRKRDMWNKNRPRDLVSKRIKRNGELKNRKRDVWNKNKESVWNGIEVNAGDSQLMLLGINLILLVKVNAARHNLLLLVKVNAARHNLLLLGYYCQLKDNAVEVKAKTVNGEVQLQALVDGKKVIITESSVRRDLQLEDAEGVDCLPNATIFEQLTLMGYEKLSQKAFFSPQWKFLIHMILQCLSSKTTAWNEFSSIMVSAIICLAINQKFNFSKYIFEIGRGLADELMRFAGIYGTQVCSLRTNQLH
ncbi:hypothetical protein Tco_0477915 [Tanacetum coccineum]